MVCNADNVGVGVVMRGGAFWQGMAHTTLGGQGKVDALLFRSLLIFHNNKPLLPQSNG